MNIHYDIWLIFLSLTASGFAMYITFGFIEHLFRTSSRHRKTLFNLYSVAVGSGLWAIHFINLLIFHGNQAFTIFTLAMFASWLVAVSIGYTLCAAASKKVMSINRLVFSGIIVGLGSYLMFYLALSGLNETNSLSSFSTSISFYPISLLVAISVALGAAVLALVTLSWLKNYAGQHKRLVKLSFSIITGITILAVHAIFNTSVYMQAQAVQVVSSAISDKTLPAIAIVLGLVCLFLLAFVVALYYEKFGVSTFQISIMDKPNNSDTTHSGYKDPLTQLPNRRAFQRELETAAKRSTRAGSTIALAYIDLDHFKPINDSFGHHVGDAVLMSVAKRLNTAVRVCDSVARIGGDEFVALIEEIKSDEDIIPIVERIVKSIKEPFLVGGQQIDISCSVGIAVYPRDGDTEKLMICADAAMYKAKENGKNQFKFFDAEIEYASDQMLEMQRDLHSAIKNNQFSLVFQPKVDCKTQSPVGVEALIRWNHPTKGLILPTTFIPAAERFGLINQINDWVVEEGCRAIHRAKEAGINLNISINLARQQFRNPNLVDEILTLRKRYDIPAENLMFEIKETTAIRNEGQFKHLLRQFKAADIKVALDDFGSHQFSLSYLQHLNIDEIKLDKVFIAQINENKASRALVDAVIRLAHALDLNVVAEGVETEAQREALTDLGCNQMQGYLFSKPLPEENLFKLLKQLNTNFESTGQFLVADYQTEAA
ncbi:MAG: GGDEF-domain containing protein [Methylotenera sp.]|nr:MAG: GGDEF-domain containing protein [Methylotenera sp.]